jgi:hypothetical protein
VNRSDVMTLNEVIQIMTSEIVAVLTWALEERLCPVADVLQKVVQIRKELLLYSKEDKRVDNAVIERFADVLESKFACIVQRLAEFELQHICFISKEWGGFSLGLLSRNTNRLPDCA